MDPRIADLLNAAVEKQPSDVGTLFSDIVRDKAIDIVNQRREEIAQSYFGEPDYADD